MRVGIKMMAVGWVLLLSATLVCWADTVRLRNGQEVTGLLAGETYPVTTSDRGRLLVPLASIRSMTFKGDGLVEINLVDGSGVSGRLEDADVVLKGSLYSTVLSSNEVAEILIDPRSTSPIPPSASPASIPAGTRIRVMLAEPLDLQRAVPDQTMHLCVAEDVSLSGRVLIPRGWPALGLLIRTSKDKVTAEVVSVSTPGGTDIPVGGSAEFGGGLSDAERILLLGAVMGSALPGNVVEVPAGSSLEAVTKAETQLDLTASQPNSPPWQVCREFLRFAGRATVPLEEVDPKAGYAPFDRSFTVAVPLVSLLERYGFTRSLPNLLVSDACLAILKVDLLRGEPQTQLNMNVFITVLPSEDKRADLRVTLVDGQNVYAQVERLNIDAEERKTKRLQFSLAVDRKTFDRALASPNGRLLVELSVANEDQEEEDEKD